MYTKNTECRMCKGARLVKFLDLGEQPFANGFLAEKELRDEEPTAPLEVYLCSNCNLTQLLHVVDPEVLFRNYVYFSSGMPKVSSHWQAYADDIRVRFLSQKDPFVVEVGSNDGVLLRCFQSAGYWVLGVDPAKNIAELATKNGIPTLPEFFSEDVARRIRGNSGEASVILANNVFAHINNHYDFLRGVDVLLAHDGVLVIEAPYVLDMFKNLAYDTIYHEHLSYLAVRPMVKFFARFGFAVFDVQLVKAQGISLRVFVGRRDSHTVNARVGERIQEEYAYHLDQEYAYRQLARRVATSRSALFQTLIMVKGRGKKIAAYGAPAKGNTLLNYSRIGPDLIDYALEDLPSKQGFYTPGMYIPVVSREYATAHPPDYYLLLAWNYKDAILEKEQEFMRRGGKFIIPIGDEIAII